MTATAAAIAMALQGSNGTNAKLAVKVFSGPDRWSDIDKCLFPSRDSMGLDCGIKPLTHFSENKNMDETAKLILAEEWPRGGTLTALALRSTIPEFQMSGRSDAHSIIIVITDGRPTSPAHTLMASEEVGEKARLMWVPVLEYAPTIEKQMMEWASGPKEENVISASSFEALSSDDAINSIMSDMCPEVA